MSRRNPYGHEGHYDARKLAIESFWPTKRHWLLGSPYAMRTRSPFLELKDFPDAEEVISLLRENEDIEVEFDTIGREMKIFEVWDERTRRPSTARSVSCVTLPGLTATLSQYYTSLLSVFLVEER